MTVLAVLAAGACADHGPTTAPVMPAPEPSAGDAMFLAVGRTTAAAVRAERTHALRTLGADPAADSADDGEFYLAVHRRALAQPWFLEAYLEQYFPGAMYAGAGQLLGTRVVELRLQNGNLFLFEADRRRQSSDVFRPEVILEAYPVVDDEDFAASPWAEDYILIDPARGLNRFGLIGDYYAAGRSPAAQFMVELSYLKNYRPLRDGISYQQVITGYSTLPEEDQSGVEANPFRAAATVTIALRAYSESPEFVEVPMPAGQEEYFYFGSTPRLISNTGVVAASALRWNLHPGMAPIEWIISPSLLAFNNRPNNLQYDFIGAVKRGVEMWNEAFGFTALTARVGGEDETHGGSGRNFILFDPNPAASFAVASHGYNPNTGELRSAGVYLGATWFDDTWITADPGAEEDGSSGAQAPAAPAALGPRLVWEPVASDDQMPGRSPSMACALDRRMVRELTAIERMAEAGRGVAAPADTSATTAAPLNRKQKLERIIAFTVAHEIGHTLGLRHNFKGSQGPPSTSLMDYLAEAEVVQMVAPGPYDVAALRHLYGLSPEPPSQPFCTDGHSLIDPTCAAFDRFSDSLTSYWIRLFSGLTQIFVHIPLEPQMLGSYGRVIASLVSFMRTDDATQGLTAWNAIVARLGVPVPASETENPMYVANIDTLMRVTLQRLFTSERRQRLGMHINPVADVHNPEVLLAVIDQMKRILSNEDGARSFETRRLVVDILKRLQIQEAMNALNEGRPHLQAALALGQLDEETELQTAELLERINAALRSYWNPAL